MKNIIFILVIVFSTSICAKSTQNSTIDKQLSDGIRLLKSQPRLNKNLSGSFATVGGGLTCNYTTIQSAIYAGESEIRIASDIVYNSPLSFNNQSLSLRGGFANCIDAVNNIQSGGLSIITANASSSPVITIQGSLPNNTLSFENIQLSDGTGNSTYPGGGISSIGTDIDIYLKNVLISNNTGILGGAISIIDGNTNVFATDTLIKNNSATNGGGIYCTGNEATLFFSDASGIVQNTSTSKGGGVYIEQLCSFTLFSGSRSEGGAYTRGVHFNNANAEGGGIYADSGANILLYGHQFCSVGVCMGDNANPVSVVGNISDFDNSGNESGGGIYASGAITNVTINAGWIAANVSGGDGGGIYVGAGADLTVSRLTTSCWDNTKCNYFLANNSDISSGISGSGGAIYNSSSQVDVSQSYFENNRADFGTVFFADGISTTTIESSTITNNGNLGAGGFSDNYVLRITQDSQLNLIHTTIADNNEVNAVFGVDNPAGSGAQLKLYSSIVYNQNGGNILDTNQTGIVTINCLVAHESTSLIGNIVNVVVNNPFSLGGAGIDYHLNLTYSPAIDICDDSVANVQFRDIDNQVRGWDHPILPNSFPGSVFDAGADEAYIGNPIFKDGFE